MAKQLEKNGYLRIETDAQDRRKQRLVVTEHFMRLEQKRREPAREFMSRMYAGISEQQLPQAFQALLQTDRN